MDKEKNLKCVWCKRVIEPTFQDVFAKYMECKKCGKINYLDFVLINKKSDDFK